MIVNQEEIKTISVVIKNPGEKAEIKNISLGLKELQTIVHGYIESVPFPGKNNLDFVLNDEGKILDMEANIFVPEYEDIFVGPLIVLGVDEKKASWTNVPKEEMNNVLKFLEERSCERGVHVNLETMQLEETTGEER